MNNPQINESENNILHVLDILNEMRHAGLATEFIFSLMENCQRYEGIRDLMDLWFEGSDTLERDKIVVDLHETLQDILDAPLKTEEKPYLSFEDLQNVKNDVIAFKDRLRAEVDRQGGINELARKTGIPQPSLSRFFASSAMPRRTTLYKIAKGLNLTESAIGFKWIIK